LHWQDRQTGSTHPLGFLNPKRTSVAINVFTKSGRKWSFRAGLQGRQHCFREIGRQEIIITEPANKMHIVAEGLEANI
jgi:hypothetical protein